MDFLKFNFTKTPNWRRKENGDTMDPSITTMLKNIVHFREKYEGIRKDPYLKDILKNLEKKFFVDIQVEENIGVKDDDTTKPLINDNEKEEQTGRKRHLDVDETKHAKRPYRRISSTEEETDCISKESLETIMDFYQLSEGKQEVPAKSRLETIKLYKAYKHLKSPLEKFDANDSRNEYASLLDVDYFMKETHKILMTNIEDMNNTPPGHFSTQDRYTFEDGHKIYYPKFNTESEASQAVQIVVDQYNEAVEYIKSCDDDAKKVEGTFKCSAKLLFCFLTLHPFSDGNGRLGRLLCSYCLSLISPFPTAVYNVYSPSTKDDYIKALKYPRDNVMKEKFDVTKLLSSEPSDLCTMIIESNWYSWREFFKQIDKYANERDNKIGIGHMHEITHAPS